jgi:superfamily II DNA or RNA helicase
MNNQEKGLLYEKYVKDFIIQKLGKNAYLWNECPENILIENNLIHSHNTMRLIRKDIKEGHLHNHKDIGIDIIQIENDECSIVQCKNGYNNGLCVDDISGIMMRCAFIRDVNTFIYYTECLSRNIRYTSEISPYVISIDCSNQTDKLLGISNDNKIYFIKLPYENNNEVIQDIKIDITPYSYQIEAINKFKEHYQSNNRGILSLPCGCGKTYTSYLISNDYKHIVILSPLREFASQNLNRFIEYGYNKNNTLLVDTDGNRDIDSIKEFITEHNNMIISCTYNSMDLISECLDLFKEVLFIIDEFHNLSKANISDSENNIFKLLTSDHRILFMSATPRIYDIEYDDNESYEMECLFGDVVYKMTFTDAIANEYITDYKIWLPSIHENDEELDKELSIYDIDNQIKNRCKFLYSCIANNGSRKCIIYCKDTEDMKAMMECMKTLNDFYIMDVQMQSISCEDSEKKRKSVLESFANNNKIQLLFNIRILNECIDISACDSIYISYAPKNKITTIQRISRATRSDKNNPYKIANVYIWCEAYEEILETLSSIKEYDIMFKDKIKVNAVEFYHSKEDKEIELVENDKVLLSNCIVGVKEFRVYSWEEKLEMVEEYIETNDKLPPYDITKLGRWISSQKKSYLNNDAIMKTENIRKQWEEFIEKYSQYFKTNEDKWKDNLKMLYDYVEQYNKLPSGENKNKEIKSLGKWVGEQKLNYKGRENRQGLINKNKEIGLLWQQFMNKCEYLFKTNEELWKDTLELAEKYIIENKKTPSLSDKNNETKKLAKWLYHQNENYKTNTDIIQKDELKALWEQFINKHKFKMFMTNEEWWYSRLNQLKEFIRKHNKLPTCREKNQNDKDVGIWLGAQKRNYILKKEIMTEGKIRIEWEKFINDNSELFMTNEEMWLSKFKKLCEFIEKNNKLPSRNNEDKTLQTLPRWIQTQKENYENNTYIMKQNTDIKLKWEEFASKYPHLF